MRRRDLVLPCFLLLAAAGAAGSASAASPQPRPRAAPVSPAIAAEFVRRSCQSTSFPRACERSLMPQAPTIGRSPRRLAHCALAVAADAARNGSAYIGPPKGGGAMRDCAETVRDAADLLRQSVAELAGRMGRPSSSRFKWRLSNVQTWASAALTDADTCLDSLVTNTGGGGAPRDDVKRRVVAVEQATSNALALVNRLQPPRRRVPLHQ